MRKIVSEQEIFNIAWKLAIADIVARTVFSGSINAMRNIGLAVSCEVTRDKVNSSLHLKKKKKIVKEQEQAMFEKGL